MSNQGQTTPIFGGCSVGDVHYTDRGDKALSHYMYRIC